MSAAGWECEAYGQDAPPPLRGVCFVEQAQARCPGPRTCREVMTLERRRVWERLQAMAAGDVGSWEDQAVAVEVLRGLSGPSELLGGEQ